MLNLNLYRLHTVDVLVSRLHPNTVCNELVDCVQSVKGNLSVCNVDCKKLQSKYESLYCSFYVAISVDSAELGRAAEFFYVT